MRTYKEIRDEARGLFKSLADSSALRDLEGFSNDLYSLGQEADAVYVNDENADERLEALAEALAEAASAVGDMAESYTEAYMALDAVIR